MGIDRPMAGLALKVMVWLARFFAWFFAITTVIGVAGAMIMCMVYPDSTHRIMGVSVGGYVRSSWALTYANGFGVLLALGQVIAVVGALWASRSHKEPFLYTGHLLLVLWGGLWTVNAFRVFPDGEFDLIYIVTFCLICTCVRAAVNIASRKSHVSR
jgi:hypothetical protein